MAARIVALGFSTKKSRKIGSSAPSLRDRYRGQGRTILAGVGFVRATALASKRILRSED